MCNHKESRLSILFGKQAGDLSLPLRSIFYISIKVGEYWMSIRSVKLPTHMLLMRSSGLPK